MPTIKHRDMIGNNDLRWNVFQDPTTINMELLYSLIKFE